MSWEGMKPPHQIVKETDRDELLRPRVRHRPFGSSADTEVNSPSAAYVIGRIEISDRETYARYARRFPQTLALFGGRIVAASDRVEILEGTWPQGKIVILGFPDRAAAADWYLSPAYQAIAEDRLAAAVSQVAIIDGFRSRSLLSIR